MRQSKQVRESSILLHKEDHHKKKSVSEHKYSKL